MSIQLVLEIIMGSPLKWKVLAAWKAEKVITETDQNETSRSWQICVTVSGRAENDVIVQSCVTSQYSLNLIPTSLYDAQSGPIKSKPLIHCIKYRVRLKNIPLPKMQFLSNSCRLLRQTLRACLKRFYPQLHGFLFEVNLHVGN